jgi:hypothetical protein
MHGSQIFKFQRMRTSLPRQLPPAPRGTFSTLPLSLWAELWSRHPMRRVVRGFVALRLIRTFANDA